MGCVGICYIKSKSHQQCELISVKFTLHSPLGLKVKLKKNAFLAHRSIQGRVRAVQCYLREICTCWASWKGVLLRERVVFSQCLFVNSLVFESMIEDKMYFYSQKVKSLQGIKLNLMMYIHERIPEWCLWLFRV